MSKFYIVLAVLALRLSVAQPAFADQSCKLRAGDKIVVGCTAACDRSVRVAIEATAAKLGMKVTFVTIMGNPDAKYDAVFSPGGPDIGPEYYTHDLPADMKASIEKEYKHLGNTGPNSKRRDRFEYEFFSKYFKDDAFANIPALGVCYGMQMMSVTHGLPLYVDLATDLKLPAREHLADAITFIDADKSVLEPFFAKKTFSGGESHHQAVNLAYYRAHRDQFVGTTIVATSNGDRIAEAIEFEGRPAAGVQFHPEISSDTAKFGALSWFLTSACIYKKLRTPEPAKPQKQCD